MKHVDVFDLMAKISLDTGEYEKSLDDAGGKTHSFANKLKTGLATAAKVGAAAIGAATTAIGFLGKIGLDYNSQMEQYTTNFTTMLGSQEAAVKKVDELRKFAASTPLSMDDLASATQTLLAFGVNADESTGILRQLGDIALGDADRMQRLSTAFGKATAQGKLTGEIVQQMIDAGFNPLIQISEAAGETMEETQKRMSAGAISVEELEAAMEAVTTGTGQFAGGMEAASHTMQGMFSTLEDNARALAGEVFQPVSDELTNNILPLAIESVDKISEAFQTDGISGAIGAFGEVLSDGLAMVVDYAPMLLDAGMRLLGALGEGLLANLPALADGAMEIISVLADGIMDALPMLTQAAIDIIGRLTQGLAENLPQMLESGLQMLLEFSGSLRENAALLVDAAIALIQTLADGLIEALPAMIETVPLIVSNIANIINDNAPKLLATAAELIWQLVTGLIDSIPVILENMPQIIAAIWDTITAINWVSLGSKLIDGIANGIKAMTAGLKETVKNLMQHPIDFITGLVADFRVMGGKLIQFLSSGISGMASTAFNAILNIANSITDKVFGLINAAKGWGVDMIQGFVNGIASMIGRVIDTVKGLADKVRGFLHFSRPDEGPLRDYETWMPDFMKGLAKGIDANAWRVEDSVAGLAEKMRVDMDAAISPSVSPAAFSTAVATGPAPRQSAPAQQGGIYITINGARYSDERSLAQAVAQEIQFMTERRQAAYGTA